MATNHFAANAAPSPLSTIAARDGAPSPIDIGMLEARALMVELGAMPHHEDDPFGPAVYALRERLQQYLTRRQVPTDAELGFLAELSTILTQAARGPRMPAVDLAGATLEGANPSWQPPAVPAQAADVRAQMLPGAQAFFTLREAIKALPLAPKPAGVEDDEPPSAEGADGFDYHAAERLVIDALRPLGLDVSTPGAAGFMAAVVGYLAHHECLDAETLVEARQLVDADGWRAPGAPLDVMAARAQARNRLQ